MTTYEEALKIMNERFDHDCLITVATIDGGLPPALVPVGDLVKTVRYRQGSQINTEQQYERPAGRAVYYSSCQGHF